MKSLLDFFKAFGLIAAGVGALVVGPLLGILAIVVFAIWIIFLMFKDHREDMNSINSLKSTLGEK